MTSPSKTESGGELAALLTDRSMTQVQLAGAAGTTQAYVSQVLNGKRLPSGSWLDTVAAAMKLDEQARARLHRAAARDSGYKIDLT